MKSPRKSFSWFLLLLLLAPLTADAAELTYGAQASVYTGAGRDIAVGMIDATHIFVAYGKSGTGGFGAKVGTVSGDSVSFGSETVFKSGSAVKEVHVTMIDSTHALIGYVYSSTNGAYVIATISGDTVSFGSEYQYTSYANSTNHATNTVAKLDSTHVAVAVQNVISSMDMFGMPTTSYIGDLIILSISGTSISNGTGGPPTYSSVDAGEQSMAALDSSHFVVAYGNGSVRAATVSGFSVSQGSATSYGTGVPAVAALDSTHFILNYVSGAGAKVRVGTVSGNSITLGTAVTYDVASSSYPAVAVLDSTRAILVHDNKTFIATISGTTVSVSAADSSAYLTGTPKYTRAVGLSAGAAAIVTLDSADSDKGYALISVDDVPPSAPSDASAAVSDDDITVTWTNPIDADFQSVTVMRGTSGYPADFGEGSLAAAEETDGTFIDANKTAGTYYYSLFALDRAGNASVAAQATATIAAASSSSAGGGGTSRALKELRRQNGLDEWGYPLSSSSSSSTSSSFSSLSVSSSSTMSSSSSTSSAASSSVMHFSAPALAPVSTLQTRTCERVTKWFGDNATRKARVNERLRKWFGFTC